ncbi:hypothetical protein KI811_18305, partial [Geobacter hydrogenophilus]|uniref:SdrD B-like domain-containing protein n=1 Tax=Geobacter hydrogenophilus TaxID=40983 RepID=UPI0024848919
MSKMLKLLYLPLLFLFCLYLQDAHAITGQIKFNDTRLGVLSVATFDWSPGNGLAEGGVPLAVYPNQSSFVYHLQAKLGNFQDLSNIPIAGTGLNSDYEITVVLGVSQTGSIDKTAVPTNANFGLGTSSAINYFRVYYDTSKNANDKSGTGFDDGILIMSGTITDSFGTFTVKSTNTTPLDGYLNNDYPQTNTLSGTGGFQANIKITYYNPSYVTLDNNTLKLAINSDTSQIAPFSKVDPSAVFYNGTAYHTPVRGDGGINGLPSSLGQADFQFQADAISSFDLTSCTGTIGDFVWHDTNRDGLQTAGEPGIDDVTVKLYDGTGANLLATTKTVLGPLNQHGYYQFTGLCAGDYQVVVDATTLPVGFMPTMSDVGPDRTVDSNGSPALVTLPTDTSSDQTIDFGYVSPCTGSIGDFVWLDMNRDGIQNDGPNAGINGVTVRLYNDTLTTVLATTTSGPNGYYQFSGLCAGTYQVVVDETTLPPGLLQTDPLRGTDRAIDSNGSPASVTLPTDSSSDQTIDFGYVTRCTGSIGDYVWLDQNFNSLQDAGEPGIDGVTINLRRASDNSLITTTTTGPNGFYQFTGLCAGDYRVESVTPLGLSRVPLCSTDQTITNDSNCSPAPVTLATDNSSNQTIDFGFESPCTGTIGDYVWNDRNVNGIQDAGEPGINGVVLNLRKSSDNSLIATTTTITGPTGDGYYQFNGLCAGSYKVEVITPTGYLPTTTCSADQTIGNDSNCNPAQVDLAANFSSNETIDFGFFTPCTGSIGDFVWNDLNHN